jgi:hypothetical protein
MIADVKRRFCHPPATVPGGGTRHDRPVSGGRRSLHQRQSGDTKWYGELLAVDIDLKVVGDVQGEQPPSSTPAARAVMSADGLGKTIPPGFEV